MNLTKRIIACICIGLGTLMYFFFKHYTGGHIPYPFLFWLLGIALALTGMYLYRTSSSVKQFSKDNSVKQVIADLKKNGEQILKLTRNATRRFSK
jgi:Na+/phosphate symporter